MIFIQTFLIGISLLGLSGLLSYILFILDNRKTKVAKELKDFQALNLPLASSDKWIPCGFRTYLYRVDNENEIVYSLRSENIYSLYINTSKILESENNKGPLANYYWNIEENFVKRAKDSALQKKEENFKKLQDFKYDEKIDQNL